MKSKSSLIGAAIVAALFSMGSASAAVTLSFSGNEVLTLDLPSGSGDSGPLDIPFSGILTYDPTTPGHADPTFPYEQDYFGAVTSLTLNIDGATYTGTTGNMTSLGYLTSPNNADALFFTVPITGPTVDGASVQLISIAFQDFSGTYLPNPILPTSFTLADFQSGPDGTGGGRTTIQFNNYGQEYGLITSADAAVPEPAIWAMMLVGFFGVGFMMRRSGNALAFASV